MEFKLAFRSAEEVNLVLSGLAELPAKVSMNLIVEIQRQAQEQAAAQMNAEPPAPPQQAE